MPRLDPHLVFDHLKRWGARLWFSFPVQLFGLQLRQNHLLLTLWVLLALLIADRLAAKFGIKYLFLEPEYNGVVGPMSFFLVGIGLGGLIMTWNLTSYLLSARYFPFLATLSRPFGKYCINNGLLPVAFLGFYAWRLRDFLQDELNYGSGQLAATFGSLLTGIAVVIAVYVLYFRFTNKDIDSAPDTSMLLTGQKRRRRRIITGHRGITVAELISGERAWRVDNYLTENFQTRRTRSITHYRPGQLLSIFRQNHFNALALQTILLTALIAFGLGIDYAWVRIPAGASIFILFSVIAAITGAVTYWFHSWRTSIFLLFLLVVNFATSRDWFAYRNRAYGLDYSGELPTYDYASLVAMANPSDIAADRDSMRQVLERWRARTGQAKPKLVLLCVSGGGLKATYWTTHVMQEAQHITQGAVLRHTALISGASGGMIGAAFVREHLLADQEAALNRDIPLDRLGARVQGAGSKAQKPVPESNLGQVGLATQNASLAQQASTRKPAQLVGIGAQPLRSGSAAQGQNLHVQPSTVAAGVLPPIGESVYWPSPLKSSDQAFSLGFDSDGPRPKGRDAKKWAPADRPAPFIARPSYVDPERQKAIDSTRLEAVGGDLLNSVAFAIVTTDIFLPTKSFKFDSDWYRADRAYAFEQQLNENLGGVFRKRLGDYEAAERSAQIPMLLLTPSVVNDARRLIISPLGVRHLTLPPAGVGRAEDFEVDAVDFGNFFADRKPDRLAFSTALRMNATYPYVLPNVYLPSSPPVEVMDAGFRDNFGVMEASRFLQVYREWILENTSGVVMMQVSTLEKFERPQERSPRGWISSLFSPLGVAGQLISLQDFQLDDNIGLLYELYGQENFTFLRFSYQPAEDREAASMTFHLTAGEKSDIRASIRHPSNLVALQRLCSTLEAPTEKPKPLAK